MDELYEVLGVLTEISGNVKNLVCEIEKLEDQGTEAEAAMYISMVRYIWCTHSRICMTV